MTRSVTKYKTYICAPSDCPHDPDFEHDNYFGCIPKDFSQTTGRSKTHHQSKVADTSSPTGYRYVWNGGCAAPERDGMTDTTAPERNT